MSIETSVIVTSYNQPRTLALVLEGLKLQDEPDFEVVVADDGSAQPTRDLVDAYAAEAPFDLRFVTQEDLGFRKAKALNNGVRAAKGRHLLFLDGDCIPQPSWVRRNLEALRGGADYAVAGYVLLSLEETDAMTVEKVRSLEYLRFATPEALKYSHNVHRRNVVRRLTFRGPKILGGNFAARREALEHINGFDENFDGFSKEDSDLRNRLHVAGHRWRCLWKTNWVVHCHHGVDPERCSDDVVRDAPDRAYYESRKGTAWCDRGLVDRAAAAVSDDPVPKN